MKTQPIQAEYQQAQVAAYRGNPFIEALPTFESDKELSTLLQKTPVYDPSERNGSAAFRREALTNLLQLFVPLPCHLDLAWTLIRTMRRGYLNRNPADDKYLAGVRTARVKFTSQMKNWSTAAEPGAGFSVIGVPGVGKSTAINAVLNLFPQVIEHNLYGDKPIATNQVTWIKLDLPFDASVKGLVTKFLAKVDEVSGTSFHKMLKGRTTVDMMMPDMATAAALCGLGLLVIDEVQHLRAAPSGGAMKMLNFFVELSNTMGVPVVLVGTPQALEPLGSELRSARRACGQGSLFWDRMHEDDPVFRHFLKKIWAYQYTTKETPLSDDLAASIYRETQGITHLIVCLYLLAQDIVIGTGGDEQITPGIIAAAARESFRPLAPYLDALRGGDTNASMGDLHFGPQIVLHSTEATPIVVSQPAPTEPADGPGSNRSLPNNGKSRKRGRKKKGGIFREAVEQQKSPHELLKERDVVRGLDDLVGGEGGA